MGEDSSPAPRGPPPVYVSLKARSITSTSTNSNSPALSVVSDGSVMKPTSKVPVGDAPSPKADSPKPPSPQLSVDGEGSVVKPLPKVFSTLKKGASPILADAEGSKKQPVRVRSETTKVPTPKNPTVVVVDQANPVTVPVPTPTVPARKVVPKQERKPVARPKPLVKKDPVRLEIDQLRIRFPDMKETRLDDGSVQLEAVVPILDPEFPFDLPTVTLQITLPSGYPTSASASFALLNPEVPANLKSFFKGHMDRTSRAMLGTEALRPMLRFMEKNLEQMLTPPANTGGFKFIAPVQSATPPPPRPLTVIEMKPLKRDDEDELAMPAEYLEALRLEGIEYDDDDDDDDDESDSGSDADESHPTQATLPLKKVTESRFGPPDSIPLEPIPKSALPGTIQLSLQQTRLKGIGLLLLTQMGLALKCDRCKVATPLPDLRPNVDRIYACRKCTAKGTVRFMMDTIHEGSRVAGYLRCKGGTPLELLPSTFQVTCATCCPPDENPSASTTKITAVQVGELVSLDCRHCHREMSLEIGKADWVAMPGLAPASGKRIPSQKLPSAIGEPLPNLGACKHYKKSLRWFRFPCCGKAYPCDECHDEDNADHRSEWATRMICGACSREMPIGTKECACGAAPGSTRRSTHWEGGKGMRDQTQMSRKDAKKYRNLTKPVPAKKD